MTAENNTPSQRLTATHDSQNSLSSTDGEIRKTTGEALQNHRLACLAPEPTLVDREPCGHRFDATVAIHDLSSAPLLKHWSEAARLSRHDHVGLECLAMQVIFLLAVDFDDAEGLLIIERPEAFKSHPLEDGHLTERVWLWFELIPSSSWTCHAASAPSRWRHGSRSIGLLRPHEQRRSPPASRLTGAALSDSEIPSCVPREETKRMYDLESSCTFFVCTILTSYHTYVISSIIHTIGDADMTKTWKSPETGIELRVVVVKEYESFDGTMFLVHKSTATSSKFVFGVRAADCR